MALTTPCVDEAEALCGRAPEEVRAGDVDAVVRQDGDRVRTRCSAADPTRAGCCVRRGRDGDRRPAPPPGRHVAV
ncbi:hypothetical protein [Streptomyces macrosporus]|uniref:Uncharacterized protein n=1 Tax=Streptomyces macrosporus TaxID=44032 RepID=A0ABN3JTI5_9ACTN